MRALTTPMILPFTVLLFAYLALCVQGQFFQNLFNHGSFFHHQTHEQEAHSAGDASWFQDRVRAGMSSQEETRGSVGGEKEKERERDCVCKTNLNPAHCDRFLCSDTLACVNEPKECPCPFVEQKRCELGDTYVCVQQSNCHEAERMYSL